MRAPDGAASARRCRFRLPVEDRAGEGVDRVGLRLAADHAQHDGEGFERLSDFRVVPPDDLLLDGDRTPVERLGPLVAAIREIEPGEVAEDLADIPVVGPVLGLENGERAPEGRLGLGLTALAHVGQGERVERRGDERMVAARRRFEDRHRPFEMRSGFGVTFLPEENRGPHHARLSPAPVVPGEALRELESAPQQPLRVRRIDAPMGSRRSLHVASPGRFLGQRVAR